MPHRLTAPAAPRPDYVFVDAVRFWSMLSIVALHASLLVGSRPGGDFLLVASECSFKFGTIGFFLISGFLLGDRLDVAAPLAYLSRRLKLLLRPWAFWFALYMLYLIFSDVAHQRITASSASWLPMIRFDFVMTAFASAFWFVPNLAVGMCILMLFRRHLGSLKLGALLFAVNFLYVANIYGEWFSPLHTSAFFAFISFLWLGSYAAGNAPRVGRFLDSIPMILVVALAGLAYCSTIAEARILMARHSADPINTLRLSNQVFSILVVVFLFKLKSVSWPGFIKVRQQTFAIYLIHSFILRIGVAVMDHGLRPGLLSDASPAVAFSLRGILFVCAYGGSLLMAHWIASSDRWRWAIGLKPRQPLAVGVNEASTPSKDIKFVLTETPLTK